jgi:hypothetical protein
MLFLINSLEKPILLRKIILKFTHFYTVKNLIVDKILVLKFITFYKSTYIYQLNEVLYPTHN